ncbi:SDR family NAD(P)-dependent oxidoreductase [Caldalkalibacillus salinus]|uniref:SDR family NAD(P)-dependent oxidoreductase n=1 Tax=Caldalkalibacillus salinus TaxID=2803787 RepID=UPI001921B1F0|nr:SDR family oxidoreductase [Caldalkalibacillus salinus]
MVHLKDKYVVITGSSSGLGIAIAEEVLKRGGAPFLMARSTEKLATVSKELENKYDQPVPYTTVDVANYKQVQCAFNEVFERVPHIDVLINNAGFGAFQLFEEADVTQFEDMINVNYLGAVYCVQQVLPHMIENQTGHIINIASQAGKVATPKSSAYTASKFALIGFTNSLRLELIKKNIHVTAINPGPIRTPFFDVADPQGDYVKNVSKYMLSPTAVAKRTVGCIGRPVREINMPLWMEIGSRLFATMPVLMERLLAKRLNQK